MHLTISIVLVQVWILVIAFMNLKPKLEDAFSVFNTFGKGIDFSNASMIFKPKLEDAFSVFNTFGKSIDFTKGIH